MPKVPRNLTKYDKELLMFFGGFLNEQIMVRGVGDEGLLPAFMNAMVRDAANRGGALTPAYMSKLEWSGKYNPSLDDWEGGIVGSDMNAEDYNAAMVAVGGARDVKENYFKRGKARIAALVEHIDDIEKGITNQPFFCMCMVPDHYNACFVTVDPVTNEPMGYYYEPHNEYDFRSHIGPHGEDPGFLPYGRVAEDLAATLGISMTAIPCTTGLFQSDDDTMCQTWSCWFIFLMATGLTYAEARDYQAQRRFAGLLGFVHYGMTLPFTARKIGRGGKLGSTIFSGSLTDATFNGKQTSLLVEEANQLIGARPFGITAPKPIKTKSLHFYPKQTNERRGNHRYTDRTGLL